MLTAEELDQLAGALLKYGLLTKTTSKGREKYYNMRRALKQNKQTRDSLLAQLCLKLIADKTTLNPALTSRYSEQFVTIMNSYPGVTPEDACVVMCNQMVEFRDKWKQRTRDIFDLRATIERRDKRISEILDAKRELRANLDQCGKTKDHYFSLLAGYDSDIDAEPEAPQAVDYMNLERESHYKKTINELAERVAELDPFRELYLEQQEIYARVVDENEILKEGIKSQ